MELLCDVIHAELGKELLVVERHLYGVAVLLLVAPIGGIEAESRQSVLLADAPRRLRRQLGHDGLDAVLHCAEITLQGRHEQRAQHLGQQLVVLPLGAADVRQALEPADRQIVVPSWQALHKLGFEIALHNGQHAPEFLDSLQRDSGVLCVRICECAFKSEGKKLDLIVESADSSNHLCMGAVAHCATR